MSGLLACSLSLSLCVCLALSLSHSLPLTLALSLFSLSLLFITPRRSGLLACGCDNGEMTVFKFSPPAKDGEPVMDYAKCWETQPAFQVRGEGRVGRWEGGKRAEGAGGLGKREGGWEEEERVCVEGEVEFSKPSPTLRFLALVPRSLSSTPRR